MWPGVNKFNLNPLLTFFDIFHPLTYSPTPLPPLILSLHPLTPFSPGRPERETTITFHQRLSQYYSSTSSKRDGGYWSQSKRQVEIARECVCVRVCECVCSPAESRDNRQRQRECSVWPSQSVWQPVSEVWLPKAMSHSFISILLTFSLKKHCLSASGQPSPRVPYLCPHCAPS